MRYHRLRERVRCRLRSSLIVVRTQRARLAASALAARDENAPPFGSPPLREIFAR